MILNLNHVKYIEPAPEEGWVTVYFVDGTLVPTPLVTLTTFDSSSPGQMVAVTALKNILVTDDTAM